MSNDIFETNGIQVTAFVGGSNPHDKSVQISLKGYDGYTQLTNDECLELAHALLSRVLFKRGYRATD